MDTITEILSELTALMNAGMLTRYTGNRAKRYVVQHPEDFFASESNPMTVTEAANMAVELSYVN